MDHARWMKNVVQHIHNAWIKSVYVEQASFKKGKIVDRTVVHEIKLYYLKIFYHFFFLAFNCPSGQPLKDPRGREIPCEIYQNNPAQLRTSLKLRFMDAAQKNETATKNETKRMWSRDSCTNEAYCVSYGGVAATSASNTKGYCCPRPAFSCPAGSPLATSDAFCRNCPQDLYFCFTDSFTGASACCPKPCPKGDVYVNGGCLPMVSLGSQCVTHEQCMDVGSRCTALAGSTGKK